jgi:hypothetical protein
MKHYLIVYAHRTGRVEVTEFPAEDRARALAARFAAELQPQPDTEVVVVSADSLRDLKHTHSRYFSSVGDLARAGAEQTYELVAPGNYELRREPQGG